MIRVYEAFDFLSLSEVIEYSEFFGCSNLTESLLVQLINQKKIPCYVDLDGCSGFRGVVECANNVEQVTGVGMQLLYSAALTKNPTKSNYYLKGVFEGLVQLSDRKLEPAVMCWNPDLNKDVYHVFDTSDKFFLESDSSPGTTSDDESLGEAPGTFISMMMTFSFNSFHMKPSDVRAFFEPTNSKQIVMNGVDVKSKNSSLLMIEYLRDLLKDSYVRENKNVQSINQTALAYGVKEKYGISISTSQKLFAEVNTAVKDKMNEKSVNKKKRL